MLLCGILDSIYLVVDMAELWQTNCLKRYKYGVMRLAVTPGML